MNPSIFKKVERKLNIKFKQIVTKIRESSAKFKKKLAKRAREKEASYGSPSKIKAWLLWLFEVLTAGLGINFIMWQFVGFDFSLGHLLACGITYYFVTAEIPQFISNCLGGRK